MRLQGQAAPLAVLAVTATLASIGLRAALGGDVGPEVVMACGACSSTPLGVWASDVLLTGHDGKHASGSDRHRYGVSQVLGAVSAVALATLGYTGALLSLISLPVGLALLALAWTRTRSGVEGIVAVLAGGALTIAVLAVLLSADERPRELAVCLPMIVLAAFLLHRVRRFDGSRSSRSDGGWQEVLHSLRSET